jgi:hypothetical protein
MTRFCISGVELLNSATIDFVYINPFNPEVTICTVCFNNQFPCIFPTDFYNSGSLFSFAVSDISADYKTGNTRVASIITETRVKIILVLLFNQFYEISTY